MAGQILYAASQWGIITLLARQGTSAMVGEYALALAIAGPFVTFLNMKLRAVQASDAVDQFSFADYFGLRILTSVAATFLIVLVAFWGDREPEVRLTIIVLAVAKAFESISDILFGLQQKHERMDLVARSTMAKGLLSLGAFTTGFLITGKVAGGATGIAVAWLLTLLLIDIPNANRTLCAALEEGCKHDGARRFTLPLPRLNLDALRALFLLALPLAFTVTLGSLSANIPRYFIDHWLGKSELGIFAAMIYPLAASSLVISALAQSAMPRLSSSFQHRDFASFRSLLAKLVMLAAIIGIGGILTVAIAGKQILVVLYGHEYASHASIFMWVMVNAAIGYLYLFLGTALNAMRLFRVQLPIHIVSLGVLVIACALLIKPHGLSGAVISLLVASLVEATLYSAVVLRKVRNTTTEDGHPPTNSTQANGYSA